MTICLEKGCRSKLAAVKVPSMKCAMPETKRELNIWGAKPGPVKLWPLAGRPWQPKQRPRPKKLAPHS